MLFSKNSKAVRPSVLSSCCLFMIMARSSNAFVQPQTTTLFHSSRWSPVDFHFGHRNIRKANIKLTNNNKSKVVAPDHWISQSFQNSTVRHYLDRLLRDADQPENLDHVN